MLCTRYVAALINKLNTKEKKVAKRIELVEAVLASCSSPIRKFHVGEDILPSPPYEYAKTRRLYLKINNFMKDEV